MIVKRVRRKIYKAFHPAMGEVWMLHRVLPEEQRSQDAKQRDLEITPEYLEQQITAFKQKGYNFVSIDQVYESLTGKAGQLKPFVCITLDDGYVDNCTYAYPLFKKYDIPFAVYITTGFINGTAPMWWYEDKPQMMSWDQVRQLSNEPLCTIGAHTLTHPRLGQIGKAEAEQEIRESKHILEERLGSNIEHFSYPHGDYTQDICQIVHECGFKSSVLVWGGKVRTGQNCLEIPRVPIVENK